MKTTKATEICDCLMSVFYMFGQFNLHVDRGSPFISSVFEEVFKRMNVYIKHSAAYHSRSYGVVERLNQTIGNMLEVIFSE